MKRRHLFNVPIESQEWLWAIQASRQVPKRRDSGSEKRRMKSNKQRRAELQTKRDTRRLKAQLAKASAERQRHERMMAALRRDGIDVDVTKLAPSNSYGTPKFVQRGVYIDVPFTCKDCGREEVWTATQQKWWYEVAKGYVYSRAVRCRLCRHRQRER